MTRLWPGIFDAIFSKALKIVLTPLAIDTLPTKPRNLMSGSSPNSLARLFRASSFDGSVSGGMMPLGMEKICLPLSLKTALR